jgi:hypothetical protein
VEHPVVAGAKRFHSMIYMKAKILSPEIKVFLKENRPLSTMYKKTQELIRESREIRKNVC